MIFIVRNSAAGYHTLIDAGMEMLMMYYFMYFAHPNRGDFRAFHVFHVLSVPSSTDDPLEIATFEDGRRKAATGATGTC